jgi:hypothetical protein
MFSKKGLRKKWANQEMRVHCLLLPKGTTAVYLGNLVVVIVIVVVVVVVHPRAAINSADSYIQVTILGQY